MDLSEELARERRARLAAERLLELRQRELHQANAMLGKHAIALTEEIVDKREEAEEAREEAAAAFCEVDIAKRRLWDSIEAVKDGFAVFDSDSKLIIANSAYLWAFDGLRDMRAGIAYADMLALMVEEGIVNIGKIRPKTWIASMMARWEQEQPEARTIRLWDGAYIKLVDRRSATGDTTCLALNVTEAIRNERRLKEASDRAQAANRAKSAFLAKMSHELRTPMNGVVGMAELLRGTPLDEEQLLYVDTIMSSGEALLILINDVLDFSKLEAQRLELSNTEFDLEQLLIDVARLVEPTIQDRDVELVLDYDMFLPTKYFGDPGRIRQVFTNLVGNAVKFTEKGHVLIRAMGVPHDDEDTVSLTLSIEDTGIGIPETKVQHIFGEFNQVEDNTNRKFEGTGLGLAITHQLVKLMKGEIWVQSEPGKGSVFGVNLDLPVREALDHLPDLLPRWLKTVVLHDTGGMGTRVLASQLKGLGAEISFAASDALLDALDAQEPDLVMVDLRHLDPGQFADRMRIRGSDRPVVVAIRDPARVVPTDLTEVLQLRRPVTRMALLQALAQAGPPRRVDEIENRDEPEPAADVDAEPLDNIEPETETAEAAGPDRRQMRILAAEDNKTNRLVFEKLLKSLTIDLTFAENGKQALQLWRELKPDLVFMDISMPIMDGKEATRHIRAEEKESALDRTPIVALTAHAMAGDDQEALAAGIDHYLTKPLKRDLIFEQIRNHCPEEAAPVFPEGSVATAQADSLPEPGGNARLQALARAVGMDGLTPATGKTGADPGEIKSVWNGLTKQADLAGQPHALPTGTGGK